jgi:hypothetical protein
MTADRHAHTKLLNAAAKEVLGPLGIIQLGRSRTWIDDRGWWVGVSAFEPSSWRRGSYLAVCVSWLWHGMEEPVYELACDVGGRLRAPHGGEFIEYESDEQFAPLARQFAIAAAERMQRYRDLFATIEATAVRLKRTARDQSLEESVDSGIAFGLVGDASAAQRLFARYTDYFESGEDAEWRTEVDEMRYQRIRLLHGLVADHEVFRDRIRDDVRQARRSLKLDPAIQLPF